MYSIRELQTLFYHWLDSNSETKTEEYVAAFNNIVVEFMATTGRDGGSYIVCHKKNHKKVVGAEVYLKDKTKVKILYENGTRTTLMIKNVYHTFQRTETSIWDNMDENTEFDLKFQRMGIKLERV